MGGEREQSGHDSRVNKSLRAPSEEERSAANILTRRHPPAGTDSGTCSAHHIQTVCWEEAAGTAAALRCRDGETCAHLWKLPPCRAEDLRSAAAFHRETVSIRDSEPNAALARDLRGRGDLTRHPARPASFGLQG
ncbi:hypothetical protein F7725_001498 [Dissostichus mawsoni]|uniref:Uncharacterized protein n=1 Tax=Dissostichus mawsoni TaxID=36200 RepID=A0A7J5Y1I1_DISMA|nr:hypothetical protein F7725_001498 [Dissostichus mawsoni]